MSDDFASTQTGLDSPARGSYPVTPDDATDLAKTSRGLWITGTGDVKMTFQDGSIDTYSGLPGPALYPFCVKRVWATGTSATGIKALV